MLNKTAGFRGINGKPLAGKLVKNSITASWPKREEVIWKDVARFYAAIRSANFLGSIVRYGIGMEFRSFDKKIEFRSEGISFSKRREQNTRKITLPFSIEKRFRIGENVVRVKRMRKN